MGVEFDETSARSKQLLDKLHGKREFDPETGRSKKTGQGEVDKYYTQLASQVMGRNAPTDLMSRSLTQQVGGGQSLGMRGRAFAIPGEITPQLDAATKALNRLGQSGANVGKALEAVGEMKKLQGDDVLPQDAILVNRQDFEKWIQELVKFEGVDADTARKRLMDRGVMVHRDPTTGAASMQTRKLMLDEGDRVERGAFAVAGTSREGEGQMKSIMAPIAKQVAKLRQILHARGGETGPEISQLREEFNSLTAVLNNLENVYTSLTMNLDFDGDQLEIHAKQAREASEAMHGLQGSAEGVFGVFNAIMGSMPGTVKGSTLESMEESFRTGAKGVPEEHRRMGFVPQTEEQRQSNISSLVSGKMMVGASTEVHQRFLMALMSGLEDQDWSGAFRAVLTRLMLNINESLKLKHTGAEGAEQFEPGALIDMIAKGDMKGLKSEMAEGGQFEKLGDFNKKFLASEKDAMLGLDPDQLTKRLGEEGLGDIIPAEGIGAENYKGIINKALKRMDIGSVMKEMHQILVEGYSKSLEQGGKSKSEIKAILKEKLKGKEGRKPTGIPLDDVIGQTFKPWLATRGKFKNMVEKMKGMGQIKTVMSMLPQDLIAAVAEIMDVEDIDIDREAILEATGIREFATNMRESLMSVRNRLGDELEVAKLPGGVGARFKPGEGGGPGKIQATSAVMSQLTQGLEVLSQIEAGSFTGTAQEAMQSLEGINKFLGFIAHERVHQLGQGKGGEQVRAISKSLASPAGSAALGKHRESIIGRMTETLPGVRRLSKRVEDYQAKAEEDPDKVRRAKIAGKEVRGTAGEIAGELERQLLTLVSEELLAYLAQGRLQEILGDMDLGEKALGFLVKRLEQLAGKDKEILGAAMAAGERLTSSALEGLMSGVSGGGPVTTGGIQGRVGSRQIGIGSLGEDEVGLAQNKLGQLENVMLEASRVREFRLGSVDEGALAEGKLALSGGPSLRGRTDIESEEINRLNQLIGEAGTREMGGEEAKEIEDIAKRLKSTPEKRDAGGFKMYQDAMRQFQTAKATFLINDARRLETEMEQLFAEGKGDSSKYRDVSKQFRVVVENLNDFFHRTTQRLASFPNLIQRGGGEGPTPAGIQAGLVDMGQVFEGTVVAQRGRGEEAERFKKTEEVLWGMHSAIEKNRDASKQLAFVWEHIKDDPKIATERLKKMVEVTKNWARVFRQAGEPAAADRMGELSSDINKMYKDISTGAADPTLEGMYARLGKGTKQKVFAGDTGPMLPMSAQMEQLEARAKAHQKRLQQLSESPQFRKMGLKPDFEPIKAQIIDPQTNQVVQNLEANFKKVGKQIVYSMNQGGVAAQRFGRRMKDSFRRVVQWGFATGIIYGTMRAFRSLATVITDVQDRIFALKKVMDTSTTDFESMQDAAVGMAKNFGIAINEVLDGMVVYGQQGLEMNEILDRTKSTLVAVNVTTLDATGATEALTAAHKVFGDEVGSSMGFVDAWAKVAAKHAITAKDLADAVKRAGAAAGTAGLDFEDFMGITTAIGVVTRQTGKEIGTSLKFMMRGMRRPVAQKEFGSLGISSLTETGDLRPAMDILKQLAGAWDGLSKAQQLALAQSAAGIRHYNSFIILMENFDEALDASADAATSQGFAFRKNQIAMQTMSKQMGVLRETLKGLGVEVGKAIIPTVTAAAKTLSVLVDSASRIPGPLLQIGVLGAAGMLAFHKAADMVVDSLDAMMGYGSEGGPQFKKFFEKEGYLRGIPKGIGAMRKNMFGGLGTFMGMADPFSEMGKKKKGGLFDPQEQGVIVRGLDKMQLSVKHLARSFMLLGTASKVAALAGVLALATAMGTLIYLYREGAQSGQEMADEMYDQIGKSQDLADRYRAEGKQLDRVSLAAKKYVKAKKLMGSVADTQRALAAGEFKGAAIAAKNYGDIIYEVGLALATLDPTGVQGLSESGGYLVDVAEGFQNISASAIDAQNAITMALQTKVMKAFAEDITKARGFFDQIGEFFGADRSLGDKLEKARDKVRDIADLRDKMANKGMDTAGTQWMIVDAVESELELRQQALVAAAKMKEILDQMPGFEDLGMLAKSMGPDFSKALETAASTGIFGQGASSGSILFKTMAKSAGGAGSLLDYTSAADPRRMLETFMEKGVKPTVTAGGTAGLPSETGAIAVLTKNVAEAMLRASTPGFESMAEDVKDQAITAAQSLISKVDDATGEMAWAYANSLTGTMEFFTAQATNDSAAALEKFGGALVKFSAGAITDAMYETERLLTMEFTGAMAGIRNPGSLNVGPATRMELSPEQRVMESLPNQVQRMSDVHKEMQEIRRQHDEQLTAGDVEGSARTRSASSAAIKILDQEMSELVYQLQSEGFDLSVLLNFNKQMQELQVIMEKAALSVEEAADAEEIRMKYMKNTSGSLKGMSVMPSIQFGKTFKELSGMERLQKMVPGFDKAVSELSSASKRQEMAVQLLQEVEKQRMRFMMSMDDMVRSGEKLTAEQMRRKSKQLEKGLSEADIAIINSIESGTDAFLTESEKQTSIQNNILNLLKVGLDPESRGSPEKIARALDNMNIDQLQQAINELPAITQERIRSGTTGVGRIRSGEFGKLDNFFNREFKQTNPNPHNLKGNELGEWNNLVDDLIKWQNRLSGSRRRLDQETTGGNPLSSTQQEVSGAESKVAGIENKMRGFGNYLSTLEKTYKSVVKGYLLADKENALEDKKSRSLKQQQKIREDIERQRLGTWLEYKKGEMEAILGIKKATDILMGGMESTRLAQVASEFAKSLEQLVKDFKKAEAIEYTKLESDLEGPHARVGKPGFKSDFETRQEEAEKKLTSGDREERKAAREELRKIEFDKDEHVIKLKQDKEIKALKRQQAEAEKFRDILYEALATGEYADTDLESQLKRAFETLTYELERSEQATMTRGDLRFEGVPSLQGLKGMISKVNEFAKDKAQQAMYEIQRKAFEDGGGKQISAEVVNLDSDLRGLSAIEQRSETWLAQIHGLLAGGQLVPPEIMQAIGTVVKANENTKKELATSAAKKAAVTSGGAGSRSANSAASAAAAGLPLLALFRTGLDDAVTSIYRFSDEVFAVVTEMGGPGGKVLGSQSFEIKNGIITMGDNAIVNEGARGRGIGQRQLEEVARFGAQRGASRMEASSTSLDTRQAAAYERAAQKLGATAELIDPGNLEMTPTIGKGIGKGGGVSYSRKSGSAPILQMIIDEIEGGSPIEARQGSNILLDQIESRFATVQGFKDMPRLSDTIDELSAEVEAYARATSAAGEPDHATISRILADAAFERGPTSEPGIISGAIPIKTEMEKVAEAIARARTEGAATRAGREGLIEAAGAGRPGGKAGTTADILGEMLDYPYAVGGGGADVGAFDALRGRDLGDLAEPGGPRVGARAADFAGQEDVAMQKAIERGRRKQAAKRAAREKAQLRGAQEPGRALDYDTIDPELAQFEAEHGIGPETETPRAMTEAEIRSAPGEEPGGRARKDWMNEILTDPADGKRKKRKHMLRESKLRAAQQARGPRTPIGQRLSEFAGRPGVQKGIGRGLKGVAGIGAGLQGAQIGGLMHQASLGGNVGEGVGLEAGLWALGTGGALAGGAIGSALGPLGMAGGALAGGFGGVAAGLLGEDYLKYAGGYYDEMSGGGISKAAGAAGGFISQPGAWLGEKFGQTGMGQTIAGWNLPTWLGGPGAPGAAGPPGAARKGATGMPPGLAQHIASGATGGMPGGLGARRSDPDRPGIGHKFPLVGTSLEAANAQGGMYLPSSEAENAAGVIRDLVGGARVFRPSDAGAGVRAGASGAAQSYIEKLRSARSPHAMNQAATGHYGGATNTGLVADRNFLGEHGVAGTMGAAPTTIGPTGNVRQTGTAERVSNEADASLTSPTGPSENSQAILQVLTEVSQGLAVLSQTGVRLPENFTQSIEAANEAVVRKLDDVTITSLPEGLVVGITESSISSLANSIGTSTGGAAVGAQQIADSIGILKSELIGDQGLVDQKITSSLGGLEERVGEVETQFTSLSSNTAGTVEGFQQAIDESILISEQTSTRIELFEEEFITIQDALTSANDSAQRAEEQAELLRDSLTRFRDDLDLRDNQLEASVRSVEDSSTKIGDRLNVAESQIGKINERIVTVSNIARNAQNVAIASRRV